MAKKIYILEDDPGIRDIMELILVDEGFEVNGFTTVRDFLSADLLAAPDLYLLDVMLPDGNGIEVCKELKSRTERQDIPVLIMSAHVGLAQMRDSCGAQGYIEKPFDVYQLIDQIRIYAG